MTAPNQNSPGRHLFDPGEKTELGAGTDQLVYCWKDDVRLAIRVALATRRALLIQGEPGVGKSAIAAAAAKALEWTYHPYTVTSRTEAQDLTWRFDFVRRLADAQSSDKTRGELDDHKYLIPGPFWWALDRASARRQGRDSGAFVLEDPYPENEQREGDGAVVLIDEIDKADPAVANDLLETLGESRFRVDGIQRPFSVTGSDNRRKLLAIFTSNDERDLPDAFIRRCVVHRMRWPRSDEERNAFNGFLREVATANWMRLSTKDPLDPQTAESVMLLEKTIEAIWNQRESQLASGKRPPGLAEFLDALAACREFNVKPGEGGWEVIERLVWRKQDDL